MTTTPAAILGTWALLLPVIVLLGIPLAALLTRNGPDLVRLALWSGLATLVALAVVGNHFWPARSPAMAWLLGGATAFSATVLLSRRVRGGLRTGWTAGPGWIWLLAAVAVGVLAVGSAITPTHYDFGLYHWAGIRFAAEYATVPGLGNLSYLGYANSAMPLAAILMNGPAGDFGFQTMNGLLALLLLGDALIRLSARCKGVGVYASLMGVMVVWLPLLILADLFVASPTSDTATFILTVASLVALADALGRRRPGGSAVMGALLPLLIATSMRPQALVLVVVAAAALLVVGLRAGWGPRAGRGWVSVGVIALVFGILMLARDYVLTGRAVYPISLWAWDVPWLAGDPADLRRLTIGIARDPSPSYQSASAGYAWLPHWILAQSRQWEALAVALLAISCLVAAGWARRRGPLRAARFLLLISPGVVYALIWVLLLPPTWRHAYGAVLGTFAVALGWLLHAGRAPLRRLSAAAFSVIAVVAVACLGLRYPAKVHPLPQARVASRTLPSGITVLIPTDSDQCWGNGLLCAPAPPLTLRLLGDDIGEGFSVQPPG